MNQRFLIIQTAFIGDVILATSVAEKLHAFYPHSEIDFVVRKGNESLLFNHPFIKNVFAWDKKNNKIKNLFAIARQVKANKYDTVVNLHRFSSSGVIVGYSGAKNRLGFDKNPMSFLFTKKVKHEIGNGKHEVERNQELIEDITDTKFAKPKLYPSKDDYEKVKQYKSNKYVCIAPTSVWFTKQFPQDKWVELCNALPSYSIYLLGAQGDADACERIKNNSNNKNIINLSGKLSFMESAALMKDAEMNYVNDSAPMHIASAMNAATTAIFCSTIPAFGFGPLSDNAKIVETKEVLDCRPCGIHGHTACPKGHFKCAYTISINQII